MCFIAPLCAIPVQCTVVRLSNRDVANHAVSRRVNDLRLVRAPARDEHPAAVAGDREAVGLAPTSMLATTRSEAVSMTLTVAAPSLLT